MDDSLLNKLANMALIQNNITRILGTGKATIPRDKMHKLSALYMSMDREFVDLILGNVTVPVPDEDISAKIKAAKAELAQKNQASAVKTHEGTVVVQAPEDVPEHVKVTKKKRVSRKAKKDAETDQE